MHTTATDGVSSSAPQTPGTAHTEDVRPKQPATGSSKQQAQLQSPSPTSPHHVSSFRYHPTPPSFNPTNNLQVQQLTSHRSIYPTPVSSRPVNLGASVRAGGRVVSAWSTAVEDYAFWNWGGRWPISVTIRVWTSHLQEMQETTGDEGWLARAFGPSWWLRAVVIETQGAASHRQEAEAVRSCGEFVVVARSLLRWCCLKSAVLREVEETRTGREDEERWRGYKDLFIKSLTLGYWYLSIYLSSHGGCLIYQSHHSAAILSYRSIAEAHHQPLSVCRLPAQRCCHCCPYHAACSADMPGMYSGVWRYCM